MKKTEQHIFSESLVGVLVVFISVLIAPLSTVEGFKLSDTGQTECYRGIAPYDEIPCEGTGQDGAYNINPFSYTDNGDGTVWDNNTGLMWGGGYPLANWYQAAGVYDATYNPTSQNICGESTFLGYSDWRLPTKKELMSRMNYSSGDAALISTLPPPGLFATATWSSSSVDVSSSSFVVDSYYGTVEVFNRSAMLFVACVRGEQLEPRNFTDNKDGTVTDKSTGLIWQQGMSGEMTWQAALDYCEGLNLANQTDWRLPNVKELVSSIDDSTTGGNY